jgi:signal transduction histidine kinase
LTNVAGHAGASSVRVELEERDGIIRLEVCDDGRGISEEKLSDPTSFGLHGMRERAGLLGGELLIAPGPEKGTQIILRLPRAPEPSSGGRS